jgi:hypothetical protein
MKHTVEIIAESLHIRPLSAEQQELVRQLVLRLGTGLDKLNQSLTLIAQTCDQEVLRMRAAGLDGPFNLIGGLTQEMRQWIGHRDTAEQPAHAGGQGKTVEAMLQNAGITMKPGVVRLLSALDTTLPPIKAPLTFNTARVLRCTACNLHWPKDGIELVYTHTDVNDVPGPDSLIMCPNCLASEADGKPCVVPHR